MKDFRAALKWLESHEVCRGPFGLHRMEFLMARLGDPHLDVPCVLVGGTNGKGSVTALLESIFSCSEEYQAGSTISPHLVNVAERIRLQSQNLAEKWWVEGANQLHAPVQIMEKEPSIGNPSFFELVTALAFWAFRETERDIAILEVGLGGRLDATNVSHPEVSVITNIGTDHKELLGPDRPTIAREKLGIVRKKGVLVTAETDPEILAIFAAECREKKAELVQVKKEDGFSLLESTPRGHKIRIPEIADPIDFPLAGKHQLTNLSLVLGTMKRLRKHGFQVTPEAVAQGIARVTWPGRLQWASVNPAILLDGAHNQEGLNSLLDYLREFPLPRPCHLILGALQNKPADIMARSLLPFADSLTFVPPATSRALTRSDFDTMIKPTDPRWQWCDTLEQALNAEKTPVSTLITGSLYLVADYLKHPRA